MDDIFRQFFGFSGPHSNRPFGDDNDDLDDNEGDRNDLFGDSFFHFNGLFQRQMEAMQGQMEEMFKSFGAVDFPSESDQQQGRFLPDSPRDNMLKGPEPGDPGQGPNREILPMQPPRIGPPTRFGRFPGMPRGDSQDKKDTDLDGQIGGQEDIGKLFERDKMVPHTPVPQTPQSPWSWSSGFSRSFSRTFRNGHMEESETIRHSDGSTEKIVRQKHGDKTHTTTYRTDKHGHTEKSESFQNMDEKDLPLFGQSGPQGRQPMITAPQSEPSVPDLSHDDKSYFSKLFGFDFWKPKS